MKQYQVLAFLLLTLLLACNKTELPPNMEEDPAFSANFSFGQENFSLAAGKNNLFMHTSKTFLSDKQVNVFSGVLSPENCPTGNCKGSFKFNLVSRTDGNQFIENQSVVVGKGEIFDAFRGADTSYILSMNVVAGGGKNPNFSWEVGAAPSATGATFTYTFPTTEQQSYSLTSVDTEGFRTSLKSPVFLDGRAPCPVPVLTANLPKGIVSISTNAPAGDAEVTWVGGLGADDQPIVADDQQFVALVNYPKQQGCFVRVTIDKLPSNSASVSASPSVNYQVVKNVQGNSNRQLGSATLQFVDEQGKIWRTDLGKPDSSSIFEILEVENYQFNAAGQPTLKLKIKLDALFFDGQGNSKRWAGSAVLAVER